MREVVILIGLQVLAAALSLAKIYLCLWLAYALLRRWLTRDLSRLAASDSVWDGVSGADAPDTFPGERR